MPVNIKKFLSEDAKAALDASVAAAGKEAAQVVDPSVMADPKDKEKETAEDNALVIPPSAEKSIADTGAAASAAPADSKDPGTSASATIKLEANLSPEEDESPLDHIKHKASGKVCESPQDDFGDYDALGKKKDDEKKGSKQVAMYMDENAVNENMNALFASLKLTDLSEEFKTTVSTVFESAVMAEVRKLNEELKTDYQNQLASARTQIQEALVDQVDRYLDTVVEEWMEQNKLAVDRGLRTEITESFITEMLGVFKRHYIKVPEEKYDLVESIAEKNDALEKQVNELMEEKITLRKELAQAQKDSILVAQSQGLTVVESAKLKELSNDLMEENVPEFEKKLSVLKESYFPKKAVKSGETVDQEVGLLSEAATGKEHDFMDDIVAATKKLTPKRVV